MTDYKNLVIIYYSGTGNAKRTSEWIAYRAREKGLNTFIMPFYKFLKEPPGVPAGPTLVGFCSATHGFNPPPFPETYLWLQPLSEIGCLYSKHPGRNETFKIFPARIKRHCPVPARYSADAERLPCGGHATG